MTARSARQSALIAHFTFGQKRAVVEPAKVPGENLNDPK
jgi:hypothetical protein